MIERYETREKWHIILFSATFSVTFALKPTECLASDKTDPKTRARLEQLKASINPDDNTYLFVGKIKQGAKL